MASTNLPFFHRKAIHRIVDDFRKLDNLTIYIGAGASVERTGVTWAGLAAEMLDSSYGSYESRMALARSVSPLHTTSAIVRDFRVEKPSEWRKALSERVHGLLYRQDYDLPGRFNRQVAQYAGALIENGRSVIVVTPNYDDFLLDEVNLTAVRTSRTVFGVPDGEPARGTVAKRIEDLAVRIQKERETLHVVYLHGLISRQDLPAEPHDKFWPVLSEGDYADTALQSAEVLETLFRDRNILILGASVTDPPLVQSLYRTQPKDQRAGSPTRIVVLPLQGTTVPNDNEVAGHAIKLERSRLEHLGVKLVQPDFFIQVPQFVHELQFGLSMDSSDRYAGTNSDDRYGGRLTLWWDRWFSQSPSIERRQRDAHLYLRRMLTQVREVLGADSYQDQGEPEPLRIEVWLRWKPGEERDLALWASSVGTWPDVETMRFDAIDSGSRYMAVRAFANGSPSYMEYSGGSNRWRSYLAKPIWFADEFYAGAEVPVGVISVSSLLPQTKSCLSPTNRQAAVRTLQLLDTIGSRLVEPRN